MLKVIKTEKQYQLALKRFYKYRDVKGYRDEIMVLAVLLDNWMWKNMPKLVLGEITNKSQFGHVTGISKYRLIKIWKDSSAMTLAELKLVCDFYGMDTRRFV